MRTDESTMLLPFTDVNVHKNPLSSSASSASGREELIMATGMRTRRVHSSVAAVREAAEAIGPVESGMSVLALTQGRWSMLDAVQHILAEVGPSDLAVWTWAIALYDVESIVDLRARGLVRDARLLIDYGGNKSRSHGGVAQWQVCFGVESVRLAISHAKMVRIASVSGLRLLLRGSLNFNLNARWEQVDLTEGGPEYAHVCAMEACLPALAASPSQSQVFGASRLSDSWDAASLASVGLGGLHVWHW